MSAHICNEDGGSEFTDTMLRCVDLLKECSVNGWPT